MGTYEQNQRKGDPCDGLPALLCQAHLRVKYSKNTPISGILLILLQTENDQANDGSKLTNIALQIHSSDGKHTVK